MYNLHREKCISVEFYRLTLSIYSCLTQEIGYSQLVDIPFPFFSTSQTLCSFYPTSRLFVCFVLRQHSTVSSQLALNLLFWPCWASNSWRPSCLCLQTSDPIYYLVIIKIFEALCLARTPSTGLCLLTSLAMPDIPFPDATKPGCLHLISILASVVRKMIRLWYCGLYLPN